MHQKVSVYSYSLAHTYIRTAQRPPLYLCDMRPHVEVGQGNPLEHGGLGKLIVWVAGHDAAAVRVPGQQTAGGG